MPRAPRLVRVRQTYSADLKARAIWQHQILKKKTTSIAIDLNMPLRVVQRVIQTWNELGVVRRQRKGMGRPKLMLDTPEKQKQKKKKASDEALPEFIVVLVPTIHGASQRVPVPYESTYESAEAAIFHAIPCFDVPLKPTLSYKLTSKSGKILLNDNESWLSLCAAAVAKLKDKKKTSCDAIEICLSPDNYMLSLQARNNPKSSKKGKRAANKVIGSNALADEDDVGGGTSLMEKEQNLKKLEDKNGEFTDVIVMRNSWAHALAVEDYAVTLDNSPATDLFDRFHKTRDSMSMSKALASASASGQNPTIVEMMMMAMLEQSKVNSAILATMIERSNSNSVRRYPSGGSPSTRSHATAAIAGQHDGDGIVDFFAYLDRIEPRRDPNRYLEALKGDEVLNVGDIVRQGDNYLTSKRIGMKPSLAAWVFQHAKEHLKTFDG
ncbi:hypothetical protein GGX14DRAFT_407748 [Mycena pura]|uniref:Uncharacterized protein n=1 Tax=Mycena pura TaxID=153505 RepID=A0AAD6URL7_9AGAR|nr:hypothetical protein GGX14DRAFT_407748 [Mycena pura]